MSNRTLPTDVSLTSVAVGQVLKPGGIVNTGTYQLYSDRAIWDTTNNVYLYPGKDFDPYLTFGD